MTHYAQISVLVPQTTGVFDYLIPADLDGLLVPGCLVEVPFGSKQIQGVVVSIADSTQIQDTKPITALLDPLPVITSQQLDLAKWWADHSIYPLAQCLDAMILPGLQQKADIEITCNEQVDPANLTPIQQRLFKFIQGKNPARGKQVDIAFPKMDWRKEIAKMVNLGVLGKKSILPRAAIRPKYIRKAQLSIPLTYAQLDELPLGNPRFESYTRRKAILRALMDEPVPCDIQWLPGYDKAKRLADVAFLVEQDYITVFETEIFRDPLQHLAAEEYRPKELTSAQSTTWQQLSLHLSRGSPNPILVYGVTGAGKTELYMRAIEETLLAGKQVLYLVPEISLTQQTTSRLLFRFPGKLGLMHSRLTDGERYDTWRRARAGKFSIIVGPRSALFSPMDNIGLIVMDEFHDSAYYQSETQPFFQTTQLATEYARQMGAHLILGSATPDVVTYHQAKHENWLVLVLPERVNGSDITSNEAGAASAGRMPDVKLIDMRQELRQGNRSVLSVDLQREICHAFQAGKQSILFLNRRGSATHVFCRDCGFVLKCPRCEIPLAVHDTQQNLLCHHCGYRGKIPNKCPNCQSDRIRQIGTGTEALQKQVAELLPEARILRWDSDTTSNGNLDDFAYTHFKNHQYDILIGTQMITKGLDFPLVSLVGIILADIGLNLPDYLAPERTFQLLSQVAGRAGRTGTSSQVILQTYQPDHYVIQAAAKHDYLQFYQKEIAHRRHLYYPPFSNLVRIEVTAEREDQAQQKAQQIAAMIQTWLDEEDLPSMDLVGPVPCFFARIRGKYRWQVILRGNNPLQLLLTHRQEMHGWRVEVNPANLL